MHYVRFARLFVGLLVTTVFSILLPGKEVLADDTRLYWSAAYIHSKSDFIAERDMASNFSRFFFAQREATGFSQIVTDLDDVDSGFKLSWGYSVNTDFDWEVGFIDFGNLAGEYAAYEIRGLNWESAQQRTEAESKGFFAHVQWSPELYTNLELTLRLGLLRWDAKRDTRFQSVNPFDVDRRRIENEAGVDEYYGAGLLYNFGSLFGVRLDWNRYKLAEYETDSIEAAAQIYF